MLKIRWFGHSLWQIKSEDITIVTDPYTDIGYNMDIDLKADILLSSHDHFDHNNLDLVKGNPVIIREEGKYSPRNIEIEMFPVWHDHEKGAKRGKNLLMKFTVAGKSFLHCGDLGHPLSKELIKKLGKIDLLMVPVGAVYTINAAEAYELAKKIDPEIIFPMHYNTSALNFELEKKDNFLSYYSNIKTFDESEIELTEEYFEGSAPIVIVMNYE